MFSNLKGISFEADSEVLKRISFEESNDFILVKYGNVISQFPISRIPSISDLDLSKGDKQLREVYLRGLFENVLYAALELYVLVVAKLESENAENDKLSRAYMGEYIRKNLCRIFAAKVRNRDITVTCDETNNTPEKANEKDHTVHIHFKPVYGELSFHSISISRTEI